jgi:hypothetical protein
MADLDGRRELAKEGKSRARWINLPLRVSRRARSIALCWCRFSAVLTRFRGLDLVAGLADTDDLVEGATDPLGMEAGGEGWLAMIILSEMVWDKGRSRVVWSCGLFVV